MAHKNTTHVGAADSIVGSVATTMLTDDRKGSPSCGVFSRKQEKTHPQNDIIGQVSMREDRMGITLKGHNHAQTDQ